MSEFAIKVNDVSKAFLIGLKDHKKETLGGTIFSWLRYPLENYNVLKKLNTYNYNEDNEDLFWALKNISFELKHGETLGIIGNNGAGKSTLLKIICRITNPTYGFAEVNGRVSSLLEVGTGFNAELTGRENVYLNGTILGMKKKEIDKKFDEIVDFSGVEQFIDTQIKKYSSGMKIRLAFAVAASLETEIMIIDEVLSIGDAEFRKKSLERMIEIARSGTAVILVTHNMLPIQNLCSRAILLEKGRIANEGITEEIVSSYMGQQTKSKVKQSWELGKAPGSEHIKMSKAEVRPLLNIPVIRPGDPFEFEFLIYNLKDEDYDLTITFHLTDEFENLLFIGSTAMTNRKYIAKKGFIKLNCRIPENLFNAGKFTISKFLVLQNSAKLLYEHKDLLTFEVTSDYAYEHGKSGRIEGLIKPKLEWEVTVKSETEVLEKI
ncbi:MAG: ABC transporter ATP-binding protein [Ignavibacteria bacterium]|nr:ABC transporter ATP-binding protein [Ignavibacteria bacterium]